MPVNTAALKTFAPAMRRQLLEAVGRKLDLLLHSQTPDTLSTYAKQIAELREQEAENREQLLERVAYTWFNRLCALRYLDARGWHPFGCKVLMPAGEAETQPELLKLMCSGSLPAELKTHTDEARLHGLLDGHIATAMANADPQGEVYRQLVLSSCHYYHQLLPNLFEGLDDSSELLLPDDLLTVNSVADGFRKAITDEDCAEVEILGWLYQFYISEKKDQVMARKSVVPTDEIPAVTQLFTPHWIVRYLVENSLGRLWLQNRPASKLREQMPYYIDGEAETDFLKISKPEEIKVLDPACGSGHMLTYAFDLLVQIYEEEGYAANEIPALILKHNLHGLDICPRAAQLAELALVFKAREQSRRFFQPDQLVRPPIIELQDVRFGNDELNDYIQALDLGELFDQRLLKLLHQFEEAKTFGSLIQPCMDERGLGYVLQVIESKDLGGQLFLRETHSKALRVLEQAEALTQRYHVVVANPPYMGSKYLNTKIKAYLNAKYDRYDKDLFSAFIVRTFQLALSSGYRAMITPFNWMFLSSFEDLRAFIIDRSFITTLVQLEINAFEPAMVTVCLFVLHNSPSESPTGSYIRLSDFRGSENQPRKTLEAISNPDCGWLFRASADNFKKIPGSPIAYWLSPKLVESFVTGQVLSSLTEPKSGLSTTDNALFLRFWHEVVFHRIGFGLNSVIETELSDYFWYPFNKGGDFRKWWGNNEYVVNWHLNGAAIKDRTKGAAGGRIVSPEYYFKTGVAWSGISSSKPSMRIMEGSIFGSGGKALFSDTRLLQYLGFLNSDVAIHLLQALSPTLNFEAGHIGSLPIIDVDGDGSDDKSIKEMISIARSDWDNFETSWDFTGLPLLRPVMKGQALKPSWRNWEAQSTSAIRRMQDLETENNRLFIAAYGLDGELQPEVPEDQITLARAEVRKDMAAFLSYATGCMMGRYSLDKPGLILANAGDTLENYETEVGKSTDGLTFQPDSDGIIPVLDG
ncbi:MAG: BREX-1 system adenine-specific DNA-methyltransferase PglX, partial [Cyanobacteria bacterium]|nr:BREX-1 system adenine-specific DNA-methyltransferase PglX [Cyanobacteria bacterium bin.275]